MLSDKELEELYELEAWFARTEKRKINWWMLGSIVFSVVWSAVIWGLAVYGLVGLARRVFRF
jgi:hypothetical protein